MSPSASPADPSSTLSTRGAALAAAPDVRDNEDYIYGKPWDPVTNPAATVNLGTAENSLVLDDVAAFVEAQSITLKGEDFDYGAGPWGSVQLRTAMANFLNANFHPFEKISQKDLLITSGATSLLSTLALTLANPSDGVLLPTPCYVAFAPKMQLLAELTPIFVRFPDNVDQFSKDDETLKYFEMAVKEAEEIGIKVKILVLCNPHNPLGRLYTPTALSALADFCAKHALHLIVDEVYAMSVYTFVSSTALSTSPSNLSNTGFTSILSLPPTSHSLPQSHIHHIYSLSKDFACGGLRIASLYTQNQSLQRAVAQLAVLHHSGTINGLLATRLLSSPSWHETFFAASRKKLSAAVKLSKGLLDECRVPYASNDNAGFFLWVDLRAWLVPGDDEGGREKELSQRMDKAGVFLVGGMRQGMLEAGWYRFIFSRDEDTLREGVRRLVRALGSTSS